MAAFSLRGALAAITVAFALASSPALAHDAGKGHGKAKNITVEGAFARASAGMAKAGGVFMTINSAGTADRLIKAASPAAGVVELHTHIKEGDVMMMRAVPEIAVEPGKPTELKPGGLHVMLIDLKAPLKEGEAVDLTLTFEKAGTVALKVPVQAPGAMAPMGKMKH